jgi:hypothetical protein
MHRGAAMKDWINDHELIAIGLLLTVCFGELVGGVMLCSVSRTAGAQLGFFFATLFTLLWTVIGFIMLNSE